MSEQPVTRVLTCPHCDTPSTAIVCGVALWDGRDPEGAQTDPPAEWALLQCQNCRHPILQARDDFGPGFDADIPITVFPPPRRLSYEVPAQLHREWSEARTCFQAKAYTAALVMVRRTLEGTCADLGVKERTLQKSLGKLQSQGIIDGMLAEWADALRIAGNRGAHFTGEAVSREDAEDALAFAEALLDHVYVLRKRFAAFKQRIAKS